MITDKCLTETRPHFCFAGEQRVYTLPNGYRLSAVNPKELHDYPFAWEFAVILPDSWTLTYYTPLTEDVEVFLTDDEANAFIEKAIAWAEGRL